MFYHERRIAAGAQGSLFFKCRCKLWNDYNDNEYKNDTKIGTVQKIIFFRGKTKKKI